MGGKKEIQKLWVRNWQYFVNMLSSEYIRLQMYINSEKIEC